jgi:hypothetical protein
MPIDEAKLRELDAIDQPLLIAIAATKNHPTGSLSKAVPFVCSDGKTYWLKRDSQQGLAAELIAGRLAAYIGAGPPCRVVQLPSAAIQPGVQASHLEGTVFGSESVPNSENSKDLARFLSAGTFSTTLVDERSRALTIAFQTWVCVRDQQLLVRFDNGRVCSIDHGNCFGNLDDHGTPNMGALPDSYS